MTLSYLEKNYITLQSHFGTVSHLGDPIPMPGAGHVLQTQHNKIMNMKLFRTVNSDYLSDT